MVKIVVDAYAWIEFFIGSDKGKKVKDILEQADEIYTPGTVMAEVARRYLREGADEKTVRARLEAITAASNITEIDCEVALEVANCYMQLVKRASSRLRIPSLFDGIVLAFGRRFKAKILTGDEHFRNLPETLWLG